MYLAIKVIYYSQNFFLCLVSLVLLNGDVHCLGSHFNGDGADGSPATLAVQYGDMHLYCKRTQQTLIGPVVLGTHSPHSQSHA